METNRVCVNIGEGTFPIPGFRRHDIADGHCASKLPDADGTVDEIYCSHVLEHFGKAQIMPVLAEWFRALKPGGRLRVAVPDFDWCVDAYKAGKPFPIGDYIVGGQSNEHDFHKVILNEPTLRKILTEVGFEVLPNRWKPAEVQDTSSLECSLNLEAIKPLKKRIRIKAVMSVPRLTFSDNAVSAIQTLPRLGIDLEMVTGVFWGQCLERGMENAIAIGVDYILTIDFDTLYTVDQVRALIHAMEENPHIDALAPLQVKRDDHNMLFTSADGKPITLDEFRAKPMHQVATAHFGLTIIRASRLASLPHPWFLAVPNDKGTWGDNRTDDDIYFWRQWQKYGRTLFVSSQIAIGHMQLVASWPGREMGVVHQIMADWRLTGKPPHDSWTGAAS